MSLHNIIKKANGGNETEIKKKIKENFETCISQSSDEDLEMWALAFKRVPIDKDNFKNYESNNWLSENQYKDSKPRKLQNQLGEFMKEKWAMMSKEKKTSAGANWKLFASIFEKEFAPALQENFTAAEPYMRLFYSKMTPVYLSVGSFTDGAIERFTACENLLNGLDLPTGEFNQKGAFEFIQKQIKNSKIDSGSRVSNPEWRINSLSHYLKKQDSLTKFEWSRFANYVEPMHVFLCGNKVASMTSSFEPQMNRLCTAWNRLAKVCHASYALTPSIMVQIQNDKKGDVRRKYYDDVQKIKACIAGAKRFFGTSGGGQIMMYM